MLKSFFAISMILLSAVFVSCSSQQVEEVKTVTARGLGEGFADAMLTPNLLCDGKAVLVCENEDLAREYFVQKSCDALNAECTSGGTQGFALASSSGKKGFLARFACTTAIKIVQPAIMPSNLLPEFLKVEAKCVAACPDQLASDYAPKICDKL